MARDQGEVGDALVGTAEATHAVSTSLPPRRRARRYLRVNNVLGKLIIALLAVLAWKGFELVVIQTGMCTFLCFLSLSSRHLPQAATSPSFSSDPSSPESIKPSSSYGTSGYSTASSQYTSYHGRCPASFHRLKWSPAP